MRIPLLIDFRPIDDFQGASVLLSSGDYKVESTHKDTKLFLKGFGIDTYPADHDTLIGIAKDTVMRVFIEKAGTEHSISLYLCQA